VNLLAAGTMTFYFLTAVVTYSLHGRREDTENQYGDPVKGTHLFMVALIIGEIGGWLVLTAGFLDKQII
jgi:hypothetical protein